MGAQLQVSSPAETAKHHEHLKHTFNQRVQACWILWGSWAMWPNLDSIDDVDRAPGQRHSRKHPAHGNMSDLLHEHPQS